MVVFRLHYGLWYTDPDHSLREGSIFCIYVGDPEHARNTNPYGGYRFHRSAGYEGFAARGSGFLDGPLQTAVVRFAVARITHGLKDGLFLEPPTHNTFTVPVEAADLPAIQQLLQEKTCTYQIRQGGNLLCSAAISTNPTHRAQTGLQTLAPTSRVLCRTYALPDTDYVCSL